MTDKIRPLWMSKDDMESIESLARFEKALDEFLFVLAEEMGLFRLLDWLNEKLNKWYE